MYHEEVVGQDLDSLLENEDFQRDLVRFFGGKRHNYTREEIEEKGVEGLYNDYVDHMRAQGVNEATALKDVFYARNDEIGEEDKAAFGRLIYAWDNSEAANTGVVDKTTDYLKSIITAPSFVLGLAAAGVGGPISKIGSQAATKGAALSVRSALSRIVGNSAARQAARTQALSGGLTRGTAEAAKQGVLRETARGVYRGAIVEGGLAFGHEVVNEETRHQTIEDHETDPVRFWSGVGLSAAFGGAVGGLARNTEVRTQNQAIDKLFEWSNIQAGLNAKASQKAKVTLGDASDETTKAILDRMESLAKMSAPADSKLRLDAEKVAEGTSIREAIFKGEGTIGSMDLNALQRVAAAAKEISEKLNFDPSKGRITEAVANAIDEGTLSVDDLTRIGKEYNLSKEQMSWMMLSDVSAAAKELNLMSQISRSARKATAQADMDAIQSSMEKLHEQHIPVPHLDKLQKLGARLIKENPDPSTLQEIDSLRIGVLTSQPATTFANIVSSTGRLVVDASDQFWMNTGKLVRGQKVNPFNNTLTAIRSLPPLGYGDAELTKALLDSQLPETAERIYFQAARVENMVESNSVASKITRAINIGNTVADGMFKKAIYHAKLERALANLNDPALGRSVSEVLQNGNSLSDVPEEILSKIEQDTLSFVYQKGFTNAKTRVGKLGRDVIQAHRNYPFTVSLMMPFPRYVANQLEFLHDYTPFVGLITAGLERKAMAKAAKRAPGLAIDAAKAAKKPVPSGAELDVISEGARQGARFSPHVTPEERLARQATGLTAFAAAFFLRAGQDGETEPHEINVGKIAGFDGENIYDARRVGGPHNTHLIMGDIAYRWWTNKRENEGEKLALPSAESWMLDSLEAATGVSYSPYSPNLISATIESLKSGSITEEFEKEMGDFAATFTYPVAVLNDVYGQFNPEKTNKIFSRDITRRQGTDLTTNKGDIPGTEEVHLFDWIETKGQMASRALRFVPDFDGIQYMKSFDGKTEVPLYSPFSDGQPVRTLNPMLKQMTGVAQAPSLSELQKEMRRMSLREWEVYTTSTVANPVVDYAVREHLSHTLNDKYLDWRENNKAVIDKLTVEERKIALQDFLRNEISEASDGMSNYFERLATMRPNAYSGFIRNMYEIKVNESRVDPDTIVERYTQDMEDGPYESAQEFYSDVESVEEELSRRMTVMYYLDKPDLLDLIEN